MLTLFPMTRHSIHSIGCILLVWMSLVATGAIWPPAFAQQFFSISGEGVQLRDKPGEKVTGTVKDMTFAKLLERSGEWARISFVVQDKIQYGWVPMQNLGPPNFDVPSAIPAPAQRRALPASCHATYSSRSGARYCLQASAKEFSCDEAHGGGLRSCDVAIEVTVFTDHAGITIATVDVVCKAEVDFQDRTGQSLVRSGRGWSKMYVDIRHAGTVRVVVNNFVGSVFEKAAKARLARSSCDIEDAS